MSVTNIHILNITSGRELSVHAELQELIDPTVCGHKAHLEGSELWTPYDRKRIARTPRQKRLDPRGRAKTVAVSMFKGFIFIRLASQTQRLVIDQLVRQRKYVKGPVLKQPDGVSVPDWYHLPENELTRLVARHGRSYDAKRDVSAGSERLYGQKELVIPEFSEMEIVKFLSGPMQGVEFKVLSTLEDLVRLEPVTTGFIRSVEASAFDLRRAG